LINSLAFITANSGMRDKLITVWRENAPTVRAEEGCIEYNATVDFPETGAFQSPAGPDTIVIVEKWANIDALRAHVAAPHMRAYAEKTGELVTGRVIRVMTGI
jgi:quinol monooxygenase YgiN